MTDRVSERRGRMATAGICSLFCVCLALCSMMGLLTLGFTNLTLEGQNLVYPAVDKARGIVCLLFWILSILETAKNAHRGMISLLLCGLYTAVKLPGGNVNLVEIALLACLSNLADRKMTGIAWLLSHVMYMILLLILFHRGLAADVLMTNFKTFLPVAYGHSYGMGHPNGLGMILLTSSLAFWIIMKPTKWWKTLVFFEVMATMTLWLTISRTSAILLAIFPFVDLGVRAFLKISQKHPALQAVAFASLPLLMVVITVALGLLGRNQRGNFWIRFQDLEAIRDYGVTLWGRSSLTGKWYWLDNEYLWAFIYCGAIPFLLVMAALTMMQLKILRTGQTALLAVSVLYLVYGLMERTGLYSAVYFVPMVAFSSPKLEPYRISILTRCKMDYPQSVKKKWCLFTAVFVMISGLFYWIVAEDWSKTAVITERVNPAEVITANEGKVLIDQTFPAPAERLKLIQVVPTRIREDVSGEVTFHIMDGERSLWEKRVNCEDLTLDDINTVQIEPAIEAPHGHELHLQIDAGSTGISFQQGNSASAGKFEIRAQKTGELSVNGIKKDSTLVYSIQGENTLNAYKWIIPGEAVLYLLCMLAFYLAERHKRTGKRNIVGTLVVIANRYSYLLKTLVLRDFRIKYQSSILGVLWSFLNPLLTMFVYLFVFSMIFRSNIEHFPVYLLSGIVMFNYFSESTSLGLLSIVGNRTLITKVYMPKYIYPLAKVLSSAVNLVISFIPLFIVMLVTGIPIHKSILLLPLVLLYQIMFCTGMSLILSALNVFFRDIQFLWGILITIWNFLTPIFYPESIIPRAFIGLYRLNPLYQIIYFMRSIIIGGVSPTPVTYLYCTLACGVPLLIGIWFFRKNQDRFVLYL